MSLRSAEEKRLNVLSLANLMIQKSMAHIIAVVVIRHFSVLIQSLILAVAGPVSLSHSVMMQSTKKLTAHMACLVLKYYAVVVGRIWGMYSRMGQSPVVADIVSIHYR